MSIPVLIEVQKEIRRISIAGSDLAADDFRLKKLLSPIQKSGENIPVFKKVSELLEKVVNPSKERSSQSLLELSTLVNAILYTQGETAIEGEMEDILPTPVGFKTNTSFRRLKPVIEALTSKGAGRLEIIRQAFEDGVFKDLRLVTPLIDALDDSYAEIADMAFHILEGYGDTIIPVLKGGLNVDGGKGDARKIQLLYKFIGLQGKEVFIHAVENGSAEVKVSALKALKGDSDSENLLLEYSKDKKKEVREAALFALSEIDTQTAIDRILDAFNGKERLNAVEPVRQSKSERLTSYILVEADKVLEGLVKDEKLFGLIKKKKEEKPSDEVIDKFYTLIYCLEGKSGKNVMEFYKKCLQYTTQMNQLKINQPFRHSAHTTIAAITAKNIFELGTKEALEILESTTGKYNNILLPFAFSAALVLRDPGYVFKEYSKYAKKGRKDPEGEAVFKICDELVDFKDEYKLYSYDYYYHERQFKNIDRKKLLFDERWLELFIELDEENLVCRLADKRNKGIADYLIGKIKLYKGANNKNLSQFFQGLLQAGYRDIIGLIKEVLESDIGRYTYYNSSIIYVLRFLPLERVKEVEDLALSITNESTSRRIFEIAQLIKAKP